MEAIMYSREYLAVNLAIEALVKRFSEIEVRLSSLLDNLLPDKFISEGFYFAYGGPFRMEHDNLRLLEAYDPAWFFFFTKPAILLDPAILRPAVRDRTDVMFRFLRHDHVDAFTIGRHFLTVHDYDNHLVGKF